MKKLMVAIAAVASAFGAFASGYTPVGTAFEPDPQVTEGITLTWTAANGFDASYWAGYGAETTKLSTVGHGIKRADLRPDVFAAEDDSQVLEIASTLGNPVTLKAATSVNGQPIDGNLFFDGLVNLTVFEFDAAPEIGDAKIAMYLQAKDEEESATNLIVCAGGKTYTCAAASARKFTPGWHRITIRAIGNIYETGSAVGFVVYVDKQAVTCEDAKIADTSDLTALALALNDAEKLFVANGDYDATIKSIGFDGKGFVDELVFTEAAPDFIEDPDVAKITWTSEGIAKVTVDGKDYTASPAFGAVAGGKVHVVWTAKSGWVSGEADVDAASGATVSIDSLIKQAVAKIGDKSYATIEDAFAAVAAPFSGEATITLLAAATKTGTPLVFGNAAAEVTLDLSNNVMTVTAIQVTAGQFTIDDSSVEKGGKVDGMVVNTANTTIKDGIFEKNVGCSDGLLSIEGGKFKNLPTATGSGTLKIPDGYEFVKEGDYWVLKEIQKYALSVATPITGGTVTINPVAGDYAAGTAVTVTPTAADGYSLDTITTNGQALVGDTFQMPAEAVEVSAVFTANVYTVTFDVDGGTTFADQEYTYGTGDITLNIYNGTKEGYTFTGWTNEVAGTALIANGATLANIVGGYELKAVWESAEEPMPDPIKGGSQAQKDGYKAWVSKYSVENPAAAENVDRFILDMPATATAEELEAKLASEITDEMLKDLVAGTSYTGEFTLEQYPFATFKFEVTNEIDAVEGVSKFWRLKAYFVSANTPAE